MSRGQIQRWMLASIFTMAVNGLTACDSRLAMPWAVPRVGSSQYNQTGTIACGGASTLMACQGSGPEIVYSFTTTRNALVTVRGTAETFDGVLYIRTLAGCSDNTATIACNDDGSGSLLPLLTNVALVAGSYVVVYDTFRSTGCGSFTLSITITVGARTRTALVTPSSTAPFSSTRSASQPRSRSDSQTPSPPRATMSLTTSVTVGVSLSSTLSHSGSTSRANLTASITPSVNKSGTASGTPGSATSTNETTLSPSITASRTDLTATPSRARTSRSRSPRTGSLSETLSPRSLSLNVTLSPTLTLIVPPPQLAQVTIVVAAQSMVAATSAIAVANPAAATSSGRIAALLAILQCSDRTSTNANEDDESSTPVTSHPLRFVIEAAGTSVKHRAGLVVGNIGLAFGLSAIHGAVVLFATAVAVYMRTPEQSHHDVLKSKMARYRFPSVVLPIQVYLITLVPECAVTLTLTAGTPVGLAIGAMGLFVCIALNFAAWLWVFRTKFWMEPTPPVDVKSTLPAWAVSLMKNECDWELKDPLRFCGSSVKYLRAYGCYFEDYTDRAIWWLAFELAVANAAGIMSSASNLVGCVAATWLNVLPSFVYIVVALKLRPHQRSVDRFAGLSVNLLQLLGGAFAAVSAMQWWRGSAPVQAAQYCIIAVGAVSILSMLLTPAVLIRRRFAHLARRRIEQRLQVAKVFHVDPEPQVEMLPTAAAVQVTPVDSEPDESNELLLQVESLLQELPRDAKHAARMRRDLDSMLNRASSVEPRQTPPPLDCFVDELLHAPLMSYRAPINHEDDDGIDI